MEQKTEVLSVENIQNKVYVLRGQQVMLDYDLAEIYGYEVKNLNQQVKRNIARFPEDFMFQLTREEVESVKSQFVISRENNIRGVADFATPYLSGDINCRKIRQKYLSTLALFSVVCYTLFEAFNSNVQTIKH